jgi:hypothetical protein
VIWPFSAVCEPFESVFGGLYDSLKRETRDSGVRSLVTPVAPFNRSRVLGPVIAAAGVVSIVMLSGIAIGGVVTAAAALLAVYYLLTQVFGYEISLAVPGAPPQ